MANQSTITSRMPVEPEVSDNLAALEEWQVTEIRNGIEEADRGDFASAREIKRTLKRWKRPIA